MLLGHGFGGGLELEELGEVQAKEASAAYAKEFAAGKTVTGAAGLAGNGEHRIASK